MQGRLRTAARHSWVLVVLAVAAVIAAIAMHARAADSRSSYNGPPYASNVAPDYIASQDGLLHQVHVGELWQARFTVLAVVFVLSIVGLKVFAMWDKRTGCPACRRRVSRQATVCPYCRNWLGYAAPTRS